MTGLREWMAKIGESGLVKVNWFGNRRRSQQMVAIPCLLWYQPVFGINVGFIGTILIWIAALLTIYSMYVYMRAAGLISMKAAPFAGSARKRVRMPLKLPTLDRTCFHRCLTAHP